ncbi:MAG: quinone-dependent dihydroorotate dehydrogenase [Endozoicomonadaceae bacterium]|nr:quinone-dependent dihydroorotate dehydrogenase [Endozoicomonadaceae bacterium]MBE8232894.1 quinone-dependent dihydroorotate dehydrogenase [Endozoicomonadaceae bacterium]
MYSFIRTLLFTLPPEFSHHFILKSLTCLAKLKLLRKPANQKTSAMQLMGLSFPNRIGLAAGFDKNGDYLEALNYMGFGFIEIGTLTPKPQPGNPKPRLFRLTKEQAIINRMGFNNKGIDYAIQRIHHTQFSGILGINIGKNKDTPFNQAVQDYLYCFQKAYVIADYIAINISSPNTPGLRSLQTGAALKNLLHTLKKEQNKLSIQHKKYTPIVVKLSPDMTQSDCIEISKQLLHYQIDGVIATNTTVSRETVCDPLRHEAGGLSGMPLTSSAHMVQSWLSASLQGKIPIIGVGGIMSSQDAIQKIHLGASLIQVYTGFIFKGPAIVKQIKKQIKLL